MSRGVTDPPDPPDNTGRECGACEHFDRCKLPGNEDVGMCTESWEWTSDEGGCLFWEARWQDDED